MSLATHFIPKLKYSGNHGISSDGYLAVPRRGVIYDLFLPIEAMSEVLQRFNDRQKPFIGNEPFFMNYP